jgi:hypothetical protein
VMNNAPGRRKPTARRWTMAVLSCSGVVLVAACGSSLSAGSSTPLTPAASGSGTPATSSGSAVPCAQITALRSTLTSISQTSVSPASAPLLASDLAQAEQEVNALKGQAGPFATQADQLSSALAAIKNDAATLVKSPTPTNLTNLTNAVNAFKSTAGPLIKEMQTACP